MSNFNLEVLGALLHGCSEGFVVEAPDNARGTLIAAVTSEMIEVV